MAPQIIPKTPKVSSSSSSTVAAFSTPSNIPKQSRYPVYLPPTQPSSPSSPRKTVSAAQNKVKRRAILPSAPLRSPPRPRETTPLLGSSPRPHPQHQPQQPKTNTASFAPPRHNDLHKPGESSKQRLEDYSGRRSSKSKPPVIECSTTGPHPPPRPTPKPVPATLPAKKKPFYRPRPLWLVPFAVISALVRGMTLAPRVEVYTQLACYSLYTPSSPSNHAPSSIPTTLEMQWTPPSAIMLFSSIDPLGPHLHPALQIQRDRSSREINNTAPGSPELSIVPSSLSLSPPTNPHVDPAAQDPRALPSHRCLTDPAVQASAARLQTLMTTTMGLLSALTTTYWGRFSQKHGRTKVLAISTFGLFFTDLIFILTITPNLPWPLAFLSYYQPAAENSSWARYKHHLLLLGPIVEGALGGWTTLQSATSAYISDCTSSGTRASIFSRFTGVFYAGFSVGPMIAGYVVRHPEMFSWWSSSSSSTTPIRKHHGAQHLKAFQEEASATVAKQRPAVHSVTSVFWVAIVFAFLNFLLVLFVFPESLDKEKMRKAAEQEAEDAKGKGPVREESDEYYSHRSPLLPIVEDVEGVGGGDGFVDVEELCSPVSNKSCDFGSPLNRAHRPSTSSFASSNKPLVTASSPSLIGRLLQPLAVFLPIAVTLPTRNALLLKRQRDWSLTLLAIGLAGWMLSTGVYQLKYLYAEHVYGWGAEELSVYISWMGAVRALVLLWGVPAVVGWLKGRVAEKEAKFKENEGKNSKGKQRVVYDEDGREVENRDVDAKREAPTRLQLGKSIRFDIRLARVSIFIDLVSNILIAVTPSPAFHAESLKYYFNSRATPAGTAGQTTHQQSQAMFVAASSLSAFGGGLVPAVHSLALCIVQARALEPDFGITGYGVRDVDGIVEPFSHDHDLDVEVGQVQGYGTMSQGSRASSVAGSSLFGPRDRALSTSTHATGTTLTAPANPPPVDSGTLFGAFAVLQALGQMILGPMLFGLVYSTTVARYPKAVFILSSALLLGSFGALLAVRNPVGEVRVERRQRKFREMMDRTCSSSAKALIERQKQQHQHQQKMKKEALDRQAKLQEMKRRRWELDLQRRGRSVMSKDLRGGAVPGDGASVHGGEQSYGSWSGNASQGMIAGGAGGSGGGASEPGNGGAGLLSLSYREERALVTRSA